MNPRKAIDVDEIKRLYIDEGLTIKKIGERLGVAPSTIRDRLSNAGVKIRRYTTSKEIEPAILYRLYAVEGLSAANIGERFCVRENAVWHQLKRHGIELRRGDAVTIKILEYDVLHQLYVVNDLSVAEISRKLGVSPSFIRSELKRHEIPRRRPGSRRIYDFDELF